MDNEQRQKVMKEFDRAKSFYDARFRKDRLPFKDKDDTRAGYVSFSTTVPVLGKSEYPVLALMVVANSPQARGAVHSEVVVLGGPIPVEHGLVLASADSPIETYDGEESARDLLITAIRQILTVVQSLGVSVLGPGMVPGLPGDGEYDDDCDCVLCTLRRQMKKSRGLPMVGKGGDA